MKFDLLKVNRNSVLRGEKAEGYPSVKFLNALYEKLGILQTWILTGEGPMRAGEVSQGSTSQEFNKRREDKFVNKFLTELNNRLMNLEKDEPGYRVWFRIECKKRFPELFEEKKEAAPEVSKGIAKQKIA